MSSVIRSTVRSVLVEKKHGVRNIWGAYVVCHKVIQIDIDNAMLGKDVKEVGRDARTIDISRFDIRLA